MKKKALQAGNKAAALARRKLRKAIHDFRVRAFGAEMVDDVVRNGVKFEKPARGYPV